MSAAFDCVDHAILLERLVCWFGVSDSWFRFYLTGRTQQVMYTNKVSNTNVVMNGVPQVKVLGPILILLYSMLLNRLV